MDLSVVLLTKNEAENLEKLVPQLKSIINKMRMSYEITVVDAGSDDGTKELCERENLNFIIQKEPGFGRALAEGINSSRADRILTIDADLQHDPKMIPKMLKTDADVVIGSRWVGDREVRLSLPRKVLSLALNAVFSKILKIDVKDMSSNYRLYRRNVFKSIKVEGRNFDALQEVLIKCVNNGYKIVEVPIHFRERVSGKSNVALGKFLFSYISTLLKAWRMRISSDAVDYDERAFNSKIPIQKYWQRKRFKHITRLAGNSQMILDLGCGSSMIIQTFVKEGRGVGFDVSFQKLKYLKRKLGGIMVQGDVQKICFKDSSVDCIVYSNVIEHIKNPSSSLDECRRIVKDGGHLILATPDFGNIVWKVMEYLYDLVRLGGSYKHEHISPLNKKKIYDMLRKRGFEIESTDGIFLNAEIVIKARKRS